MGSGPRIQKSQLYIEKESRPCRILPWNRPLTMGPASAYLRTSMTSHHVERTRNPLDMFHDWLIAASTCVRVCESVMWEVSLRAPREMSGYYMGYTFKGQPVGKKAIKLVVK